jgi:hypothetical protein
VSYGRFALSRVYGDSALLLLPGLVQLVSVLQRRSQNGAERTGVRNCAVGVVEPTKCGHKIIQSMELWTFTAGAE